MWVYPISSIYGLQKVIPIAPTKTADRGPSEIIVAKDIAKATVTAPIPGNLTMNVSAITARIPIIKTMFQFLTT